MSHCKSHPNREAVAKCSRCGSPMCDECVGIELGPLVCPSCKEIPEKERKDSFWVETTPYVQNEDKVNRYLLYGVVGSFLMIIGGLTTLFINLIITTLPWETYIIFSMYTSIVSLIVGFGEPILTGLGFMGLYYKFNESICKYVLWVNIISIFFGTTMPTFLIFLYPEMYFSSVFIVYGVMTLFMAVPGIALFKIRNRVKSPDVATLLAIGLILYYPGFLVLAFMLYFFYLAILSYQGLIALLGLLMMIFFYKERSETAPVHTTW